jgi:aminoglycoside phosphotransferase (APT) family kinase protein
MTRLPGRPLLAPADVPGYLDQIAHLLARLHALPADEFTFLQDQRILVERTLTTYQPLEGDTLQAEILASARADWPAVERGMNERALVHGDYWPGNVLFRRGRLVGLIDWEQPRIGDPAKDVATARGDLSVLFGLEAANEFLRYYLEAGGRPIRNLRFWDLLISTWAVREIEDWAVVYPLLSRPDLTPAVARERIRAFATAALARYES